MPASARHQPVVTSRSAITRLLVASALVSAVALVVVHSQARTASRAVNWGSARPEILQRYRELVQLDTTAGHETRAVEYLRKVLEAEGIPTQTFALDPARANLVARLKGNGSKRPLLILAHTDVVGVQREKWPVDPFPAVARPVLAGGPGGSGPVAPLAPVRKPGSVGGGARKAKKPVLAANLVTML